MIEVLVRNDNDDEVGLYHTAVVPRVGEILDTQNGTWIVERVEHTIWGELYPESKTRPTQTLVVVYVVKCVR